jgi:hypothetical protein
VSARQTFELEWMGGAAEHHFRKARPGIEDLPWGTLDVSDFPPDVLCAARETWTLAAFTEYKAVAAFADVLRALCEARAPLDLIGMASSFVADEVVHVELASRMAMELGGAMPREVDFDALYPRAPSSLTPLERCNEMVVRVSCVAEAFSGRLGVGALTSSGHPLTHAIHERILADESLHYRLGGLYLEWASETMPDAERDRLAQVALATLRSIVPKLGPARDRSSPRHKATQDQARRIGWLPGRLYESQVRTAVREAIVAPLAEFGIEIPPSAVDSLLGPSVATTPSSF